MVRVALASALAVVLASGAAFAAPAATLSDVSGSVLVDSGKGFQKVSTSSEVAPGSRVLVSKGGKAVLAYAAGCTKSLSSNTITTVAGADACSAPAQVAAQSTNNNNGLCTKAANDQNGTLRCIAWIGGGAAVVGGLIGYAIGNNNGGTDIIYIPISG